MSPARPPTGIEVVWHHAADLDHPYEAEVEGQRWRLRLNDFPAEPLYTLFVEGAAIEDVESWPAAWRRPG